MTTVIAIDPGNLESAFVVVDSADPRELLFDSSKLKIFDKGKLPNEEMMARLLRIKKDISHGVLAIEMVQAMGMAVGKEVFETVFWTGRFVQAWCPRKWTRVFRSEEKMHLCGNMRAKDKNIRQALLDKFGPPGTKRQPGWTYGISKDIWSALAVAVVYLETKVPNENISS
jgi:hypothetical protein